MDADTITAICALAVAVVSTLLALWSAMAQRKHMKLSVRPIVSVIPSDFESKVGVYLANKGLGPMLINKLEVEDKDGNVYKNLIKHMPDLKHGIMWSNFREGIDGGSLQHNKNLELLLLEGDPDDANFRECRDEVRNALKDLTVKVVYEDLYGTNFAPVEKKLTFFGRHG